MAIPSGIDYLSVIIPRSDVEKQDLTYAISILNKLIVNVSTIKQFKSRVSISFDGYNHDSCEIFEIEEIRKYIYDLTVKFPYWFYFINKNDSNLKMIVLSLCRYIKIRPGLTEIHPEDKEETMMYLFKSMNDFFDSHKLDNKENDELSKEIGEYFS
jgi:hypothetical protein